jgi:hypothetical protein
MGTIVRLRQWGPIAVLIEVVSRWQDYGDSQYSTGGVMLLEHRSSGK